MGRARKWLCDAARRGDAEATRRLVAAGVNVNRHNPNEVDWTPLHWAANFGHVEVVQALLEAGADVADTDECDRTPLFLAARGGHVEVVRALLLAGADVHATNQYGWTPLHAVACSDHVKEVQAFLQHTGRLTEAAACQGHVDVVQVLLQAGADVRARNQEGRTPLDIADRPALRQALQVAANRYKQVWLHVNAGRGEAAAIVMTLPAGNNNARLRVIA